MEDSAKLVPAVHCEVIQAVENYGNINLFVICLDRVGQDQNIIDLGFGLQFACAINHAKQMALDQDIHLVVICSAKSGSFMAGADILTELRFTGEKGAEKAFEESSKLCQVFCALESLSVPTVAILNGTTLGGGLELGLACDYRVVDEMCTQIGLPEVKIGVLPGGGGCVRLPRLIGMKRALELILTGNSINAHKAYSIGLVDLLMRDTQTVATQTGDQTISYDYKWLPGVLSLVEQKMIGKRQFLVGSGHADLIAMDSINVYDEASKGNIEEELIAEMGRPWKEYEYKASIKFTVPEKELDQALSELYGTLLHTFSLFQLWQNVGTRFPAPYLCLLTTTKCFAAKSFQEAMAMNSLGFSMLARSAESKGLMGLFLLTRKLKRLAVRFELKETESVPSTEKRVMVLVSNQGLAFCSAFVQGLLYAGFEVRVVDVSESLTKPRVEEIIRKHFLYSLTKGYMTEAEVEDKLSQLLFNHGSDIDSMSFDMDGPLSVVDCSMGDSRAEEVLKELRQQVSEVVCMLPTPKMDSDSKAVFIDLGDPLRKNTLCVEITPASSEVPSAHIRQVASLIVASGKMPVLTPPAPWPQASHYLTLTHWALAVSMAVSCRLSEKQLDSVLCNTGGYTKGPFATMASLDPVYLKEMVHGDYPNVPHFDLLKSYITTGKLPSQRGSRSKSTPADMVQFSFLSLALAALKLKQVNVDIAESVIDVLSVSGLVHFPPTESGPLNYLVRLGLDAAKKKWSELTKTLPSATVGAIEECFGSLISKGRVGELFVKSRDTSKLTQFQKVREETVLLSHSGLAEVGQTGQVAIREAFIYPLPLIVSFGVILILVLSALCVFLYFIF